MGIVPLAKPNNLIITVFIQFQLSCDFLVKLVSHEPYNIIHYVKSENSYFLRSFALLA